MKRRKPQPTAQPIDWPRADPEALKVFDPNTKYCTMNCGQALGDPRTREECKFLCDDCMEVTWHEHQKAQ